MPAQVLYSALLEAERCI